MEIMLATTVFGLYWLVSRRGWWEYHYIIDLCVLSAFVNTLAGITRMPYSFDVVYDMIPWFFIPWVLGLYYGERRQRLSTVTSNSGSAKRGGSS